MTKDPVCGMEVDESKAAATSDYKDASYYFCAKGCKAAFDKEPEKYLGSLRQDGTGSSQTHRAESRARHNCASIDQDRIHLPYAS